MSASQEASNKAAVLAFYEAALNRKEFTTASRFLGPTYKQHNPKAADGMDGFRLFIENMKANWPQSHSEIKQAFVDGDYVILHVHKIPEPKGRGVAIIDIFRLSKGKIVEHWDVTQEIPEYTVSGNSMF
jgi:predicted SnoaL-like aldol condensation-catalyzing enzyme